MTSDPSPPGSEDRVRRVVHDLRTPLTIVAGFADLLVRRPDLDAERRQEYAGRIADAAAEMSAILDAVRADRRGPQPPGPG